MTNLFLGDWVNGGCQLEVWLGFGCPRDIEKPKRMTNWSTMTKSSL